MVKAETIVNNYRKVLAEIEAQVDTNLQARNFKFSLDRPKNLPFEYVRALAARYITEGGFTRAEVEEYFGDQRDPCNVYLFNFAPPVVTIEP